MPMKKIRTPVLVAFLLFFVALSARVDSAPPSHAVTQGPVSAGAIGSLQGQLTRFWEMTTVEKKLAGYFPWYLRASSWPQVLSQSDQGNGNSFSYTKSYLIPQDFNLKSNNVYMLRSYRGLTTTTCTNNSCDSEITVKYCTDLNDMAYLVEPAPGVEQIKFVPYGFINDQETPSGLGGLIQRDESYRITNPSADTMIWTETQSGKRIIFKKQAKLVKTMESDCLSAQ